ncbi:hypothetical protein [Yoonia sp. SS1-5]|uniref:Uncharacterized protein n=1 Tax=Yoonia rhodophyticola TaxID=3137370 RepID=A0AAN0NK25_9RHOB
MATVSTAFSTPALAGGLADAIVERQPEVIEETNRRAVPGWVLPAAALLLLGIATTGGGGGDGGDPPDARVVILDPK